MEKSTFLPEFGSLPVVVMENNGARAVVALNGAHILSYIPSHGDEVIFMSGKSYLENGKAIRGGVPVCWPWFGPADHTVLPPEAGSHGFARTSLWKHVASTAANGVVEETFQLESNDYTKKIWNHDFLLEVKISLGDALTIAMKTVNTGTEPLTIGEAFHTYFKIADVTQISIDGLEGKAFTDKAVIKNAPNPQVGAIKITGETDRVYRDVTGTVVINDPVMKRKIVITKENSRSSVVWNPWIDKAKSMKDFGDEEYKQMVCIETTHALEDERVVLPGEKNALIMTTSYKVEKL